jgi:chromosome segregation protein
VSFWLILKVVEDIWESKKQRQIIFSSHNANIVVNGDADLVVCCDYRTTGDQSGGRIKCQGAIDIEEMRKEITTVMEGGKEAFRMRKENMASSCLYRYYYRAWAAVWQ